MMHKMMAGHVILGLVALSVVTVAACAARGETPWQQSLSCDGGGYWNTRVEVTVVNGRDEALEGAPGSITVSSGDESRVLIGHDVPSIRVVSGKGFELLYDVQGADSLSKREGILAEGDIITFPLEAGPQETTNTYIYAGNPHAWAVQDWMKGGLSNGGFEQLVGGEPAAWQPAATSDSHRMTVETSQGRNGGSCARCDVAPGAAPSWVKYGQGGLTVAPSRRYRFTAWVKAENVQGKAGWFVHVDGARPQVVNRVEGWEGTFDWRQVTIEFDVPADGRSFLCGTVLHGTGTAWYDDAALESVTGGDGLTIAVSSGERRELRTLGQDAPWIDGEDWLARTPIVVRNPSAGTLAASVAVDTRRTRNSVAKLIGFAQDPELRFIDPADSAETVEYAGTLGDDMHCLATVPPMTEKTLWLYLGRGSGAPRSSGEMSMSSWSSRPINLLQNGDMETGQDQQPDAWVQNQQGITARRAPGGVVGEWCLELNVPESVGDPGWAGWRQQVAVKPNTQYALHGFVKTQGADNDVRIHGHFRKADGAHTQQAFWSTENGVTGDSDWTCLSRVVTTPPDCAFIEIHLTMNGHGTLWHDGILLIETARGQAGDCESRNADAAPLTAWVVNPLVKVFRHDDPPLEPPNRAAVYATRNSGESFVVAVQCDGPFSVEADPFRGPDGAMIDAPAVYLVGFVPVDFPIGYDSTTEPAYRRLLPDHRGNDGWQDLWPDPLIPWGGPQTTYEFGGTTPVWLDVHVPGTVAPGQYEGSVHIRGAGSHVEIPVSLTVWDFVQPVQKKLPALYDLRNGPGWNIFAGPDKLQSIRDWHTFLARFNVSPGVFIHSPEFSLADGEVRMETTLFDQEAAFLFDELHVNRMYTPHIFYACGWAYPPKDFLGIKPFEDEYVRAWTSAYRQFVDHVTAKGWRDRFVFYLSDEPFANSEVTITGLARIADMAREIAPDLLVYSSTWHYIEGLANHLTLWGIGPQGTWKPEQLDERRAAGDRFWFTTDGQMCTDTPYLGIERLLPWFCYAHGVEAYEFWGVSWWTYDPWQCGWHKFIRQSNQGDEYYWVRYPNGDGFLTYPSPDGDPTRPMPSIRLMAARDGVEDYEVFLALDAFAKAGNTEAQGVLEQVRGLVRMPNKGGRFSTDVMPDPDAVQRVRVLVGETLSRLVR